MLNFVMENFITRYKYYALLKYSSGNKFNKITYWVTKTKSISSGSIVSMKGNPFTPGIPGCIPKSS